MILQGASFLFLLALGVPIALVLVGTALIYIMVGAPVPTTIVAQRMIVGLDDFTLMSIPLFIYAGYLMNATGITARLISLLSLLLRRIYGGLSHANVLASMVFGGVSGVAAADMAAVGTVMVPSMEKEGYDRGYATSITMASSLIGPVIPPSVPFIIYGVQAEVSIGALFLAGAVPGVLLGLTLLVTGHIVLRRQGYTQKTTELPWPRWSEIRGAVGAAAVALLMPVIIIGGIVGGIFTPTEAAGIAVIYALFAGSLLFRALTLRSFLQATLQAVVTSTVVMLILAGSVALNWVLAYARIPARVTEIFFSLTESRAIFIALVIVLLMIVGMPLDPVPGLIVMTPVMLPAAIQFGVDPVHFGVIMVLTLVLGLITPPVGAVLFVATAISRISIERLSVAVLPFLGVLFVLTVIIAYVPQLSLWLPGLFAP